MQFEFPILKWWINFEAPIAIRPEVLGRPLLCLPGIQDSAALVQFQNVREDGIDLFNRARLIAIQGKVVNALEHVMGAAGHEVGECSQRTAEAIA